jgi:hypothetical protein
MTYLACHYVHDNSVSFLSMNIIGQASIVLIRIRALFWTLCLDLEITTALYTLGGFGIGRSARRLGGLCGGV